VGTLVGAFVGGLAGLQPGKVIEFLGAIPEGPARGLGCPVAQALRDAVPAGDEAGLQGFVVRGGDQRSARARDGGKGSRATSGEPDLSVAGPQAGWSWLRTSFSYSSATERVRAPTSKL
jgi:hypothetical protein